MQLCGISQDCVTLSRGRWGCCYTINVQTQGLLRIFIGYTCIAHAFSTSGLKRVWPLIRSNRYIHSVGKFSVRALNCSWQEFGRGMRLSGFPAQLGQCTQMLPWSSSCHVPPGQHTGMGQPADILLQEFSLGGFIFSLFIHLDQIPELLN